MKRYLVILCMLFVAMPCALAYAHPPEKVTLSFNQETGALSVEVIHPVSNPSTHFINRIEILQNGEMIKDEEPPRQDTRMLTVVYSLPELKPGDIIKVTAFCSRFGERSEEIKIGDAP